MHCSCQCPAMLIGTVARSHALSATNRNTQAHCRRLIFKVVCNGMLENPYSRGVAADDGAEGSASEWSEASTATPTTGIMQILECHLPAAPTVCAVCAVTVLSGSLSGEHYELRRQHHRAAETRQLRQQLAGHITAHAWILRRVSLFP